MKCLTFTLVLALLGCGSPQNHKVNLNGSLNEGGPTRSTPISYTMSSTGLNIEVKWLQGPFTRASEASELMIFVRDQNGELSSIDSELGFYAWMPSMGHPMEDAGFFEKVSEGVYLNSHIKFNMGGEWEMFFQVYDENYDVLSEASWKEFL